jgi:hypothetical protein
MPVNIPAALYGGGAFKIDSTAATDYYLKQKAKDEAKAAALDKYFTDLPKTFNPAGLRKQEIPAFDKAVADYKNFSITNRKELASGRNPELIRRAQELAAIPIQIAEISKAEGESSKQLANLYMNKPEMVERFTPKTLGFDDNGMPMIDPATGQKMGIQGHNEPIYTIDAAGQVVKNPAFRSLDITQFEYGPKIKNGKELEADMALAAKGINYDKFETKTRKDPSRQFGQITESVSYYSDDALRNIGENARRLYQEDDSTEFSWKKSFPYSTWIKDPKNTETFNKLNDNYKKVYGKEINNPEDLFVANTIVKMGAPKVVGKPTEDVTARQKYMLGLKTASDLKKMYARISATKKAELDTSSGNLLDELEDGDIPGTNYKVEGGVIYDQDGNEVTDATITIPKAKVSGKLVGLVAQNVKGFDPQFVDEFQVKVQNGKPTNINVENVGSFDRGVVKWMQDVYTKKTPYTIEQKKPKAAANILSNYDATIQSAIKAFANKNGYSIDKAVQILKKANKIK